MIQTSQCNGCGQIVACDRQNEGRAFFKCSCGRKWTTKAYYGKIVEKDIGGHSDIGAVVGLLLGDFTGALGGALVGNLFRNKSEITSDCLVCGGTGRPTGFNGKIAVFQCHRCLRTWTARW